MNTIEQTIIPFFTFKGVAEVAMNFYVSLFPEAKITSLTYFGEEPYGEKGKVKNGTFEAMGMTMMVMDMEAKYCPEFSWATTMLLNCRTEAEFDHILASLADGGSIMMGPEEMPGLRKVAWVTDKFSVTWQLVWA